MADQKNEKLSSGSMKNDVALIKAAFNDNAEIQGLRKDYGSSGFFAVVIVAIVLAMPLLLGLYALGRKAKEEKSEEAVNGMVGTIMLLVGTLVVLLAYIGIATVR